MDAREEPDSLTIDIFSNTSHLLKEKFKMYKVTKIITLYR